MWKTLVEGLKDIAPALAGAAGTAAGGPIVGAALAAAARRIAGKGDDTPLDEVAAAITGDPEKLAQFRLESKRIDVDLEKAQMAADQAGAKDTTDRSLQYEGTAVDLKAIPFFGPLMLFLRGGQRIVWGYGTMCLDWMWFSAWSELSKQQESALWVINFLVLGFLFGERAVQNIAPFVVDMIRAKVSR